MLLEETSLQEASRAMRDIYNCRRRAPLKGRMSAWQHAPRIDLECSAKPLGKPRYQRSPMACD